MNEYLESHNEREHNFHTDWEESGFDICIECDLIRKTGGLLNWEEDELVSEEEYAQALRALSSTKEEGRDNG